MAASEMVAIVLLFLAGLTTEAWSQRERATLPLTLQPTPLKGGCPSREVIAEIQQEVQGKLQETVEPARRELREQMEGDNSGYCWDDSLGGQGQCCISSEQWERVRTEISRDILKTEQCPASSCSEISRLAPDPPSGYYWVRVCSGSPVQVYCNMDSLSSNYYHWITRPNGSIARVHCDPTKDCCDISEGWTKVAYLNMTNPGHDCPSNWTEITEPKRTCGRMTDNSCNSVTFGTGGIQYSSVCGRVIGYQYGVPLAFYQYDMSPSLTINNNYVAGISITRGTPRQHIWTLAAELSERNEPPDSNFPKLICPCTAGSDVTIPPWVGEDFFCETGTETWDHEIFYLDDPLWDGEGCGANSTCCSYNHPPWFCKELPQPTTDDIEVRICGYFDITYEDIPIELIELYIRWTSQH